MCVVDEGFGEMDMSVVWKWTELVRGRGGMVGGAKSSSKLDGDGVAALALPAGAAASMAARNALMQKLKRSDYLTTYLPLLTT